MIGSGRGRGRGVVPVPSTEPDPEQTAIVLPIQTQPLAQVTYDLDSLTVGAPGRGRGRGYFSVVATEPTTQDGTALPISQVGRGRGGSYVNISSGPGSIVRPPVPPAQGRGRALIRPSPITPGIPTVTPPESTVTTTSGMSTPATTSGSASASGSSVSIPHPSYLAHTQSGISPSMSVQDSVVGSGVECAQEPVPEGPPPSTRGEKGDRVNLMTNFLRIVIKKEYQLQEYKMVTSPHIEDTRVRKTILHQLAKDLGVLWTCDGIKVYLPATLTLEQSIFNTTHPADPTKNVMVTLQQLQPAREGTIQFYNVLLRKIMGCLKYLEINRSYFNPKNVKVLGQHNNLELWPGYITAIDIYEGGLMICLNSTTRVMRPDNVLQTLIQLQRSNPNGYRKAFQEKLVNTAVVTRYNNKHYQIDDVDWAQTPASTFDRKGQPTTYVDYFLSQHGKKVTDMKQPILTSRIKRRKNDPRGDSYFVSLIPEFCHSSGLTDDMRSNQMLMRDLIKESRASPMERNQRIQELVRALNENPEARVLMEAWGFVLEMPCVNDTGRLTQGPSIQINNQLTLQIKGGNEDFSRQATGSKCYNPVRLENWVIFCTQQDKPMVEKMVETYRQVCPALGIGFGPNPQFVTWPRPPTAADIRNNLRTTVGPGNFQFVMVILPVARDDVYASVKRYCLTEYPIPSQVILGKTLKQDKRLRSVMQKVALQINCKLGGSLWALSIPMKDRIMFVGIDAHHDPLRKKPSVLGMVVALNNQCIDYYSRVMFQAPHQESMDVLRPVFNQALHCYFTANHAYPTRIVVFRDGVGDSQLKDVETKELVELKKVAESVCDIKPKFLFVVVQKRINERLYRARPPGNQLENPIPGTVMDHTITRHGLYDFFLVSQLVREGTVTPSHYIVLDDSGEGKPDLVQRLAYATSYMYFNWPGGVRVPAMCQYSHKLSMLVGQHLDTEPKGAMERSLYYL